MKHPTRMLSIAEAIARIGIGRSTFYKSAWLTSRLRPISEGEKHPRVGIPEHEVELYLELRRQAGRPAARRAS